MKAFILTLAAAACIATSEIYAQTPESIPPAATNSVNETNRVGWRSLQVTLPSGEVLSPAEVESHLIVLGQNIADVKPVLAALVTAYSNSPSAMQNQTGGVTAVLGQILSPTNTTTANNNVPRQSAQTTGENTNALGRILTDVITGVFGRTNATELQDLTALQTYLQATEPIFDRLGVMVNAVDPSAIGGPRDPANVETGTGSSTNQPNRLPAPPPRY